MLDISFAELLLCLVVALVVLGPERLPKLVRTVGSWTGQARVYLKNLTAELDRESRLSELKAQLEEANQLVRDQQRAVSNLMTKASAGAYGTAQELKSAVTDAPRAPQDDPAAPAAPDDAPTPKA